MDVVVNPDWLQSCLRAGLAIGCAALLYPAVAWIDRWGQLRPGEREPFPRDPLLPFAFALKLLSKRASLPATADRPLHVLGPLWGLVCALLAFASLPVLLSLETRLTGGPAPLDPYLRVGLPMGFLFLASFGIAISGYAGGNPLALLSAVRLFVLRLGAFVVFAVSAAGVAQGQGQAGESGASAALVAGLDRLAPLTTWGAVVSPIGFWVSVVSLAVLGQQMARNRHDESGDFFEPYSAEATGPTQLSHRGFEVIDFLAGAALLTLLYLGGGSHPFAQAPSWLEAIPYSVIFILKTFVAAFTVVIVRRSLPAFRHDQALRIMWLLLPVACVSVAFSVWWGAWVL